MTLRIQGTIARGELTLDLDVEVASGTTMVSGPNGAGKTTLLRLIAGLEGLDSGTIHHDDLCVDAPSAGIFVPAHRRSIAMAFQDHRLLPHLDVIDNIAFPLRRRGLGRDAARRQARPHADAMGVGALLDVAPARLSTGQRQRTALARALATPARTLLLDEPLASIDEASRPGIRHHLRRLDRPRVVWVTHDPDDAVGANRHISLERDTVSQTRVR